MRKHLHRYYVWKFKLLRFYESKGNNIYLDCEMTISVVRGVTNLYWANSFSSLLNFCTMTNENLWHFGCICFQLQVFWWIISSAARIFSELTLLTSILAWNSYDLFGSWTFWVWTPEMSLLSSSVTRTRLLLGVACDSSMQVALNWLLLQGNVVPIPGAKSASQVIDNFLEFLGLCFACKHASFLEFAHVASR